MTVYVDDLKFYDMSKSHQARRWGKRWCHLFADDIGGLLAFATKIGVPAKWFQDHKIPHFDITPWKRMKALTYGAVEISTKEFLRKLQE